MSNKAKQTRLYERIYAVVRQIPPGKVATYGQVAAIVGRGCTARMVGYAMSALKVDEQEVPWQRVINAKGEISPRDGPGPVVQRALLEREGIRFDEQAQVDFDEVGWEGPNWQWLEENQFYPAPLLSKRPLGDKRGKSPRRKGPTGQQLSFLEE